MKMIYPQRDNRRRKKKFLVISGFVGAVLGIAILLNFWNPNFLSPAVHLAGEPLFRIRAVLAGALSPITGFFSAKSALIGENLALREKVILFEAIERERDFYKRENADLANLAGQFESSENLAFARVLSKPGFSPYDTAIIGAGAKDGVSPGDAVLATADTALGIVSEAYAGTSIVVLYSTPERETEILIGPSAIQAVAVGKGGGNFEIKLPRNASVAEGESVMLASSPTQLIGAIQIINADPSDSFERALFKSSADISVLHFVIVKKQ